MSQQEKDALITEAIKGLDAEQQVYAEAELAEQIDANAQGIPVVTERLKNTSARKNSPLRFGLVGALIASLLLILLCRATSVFALWKDANTVNAIIDFKVMPKDEKLGFSETEKILLKNSQSYSYAHRIWKDSPNDPVLFANYVAQYYTNHDEYYPEDTLQLAEKIDPDNSLYHLYYSASFYDAVTTSTAHRKILKDSRESIYSLALNLKKRLATVDLYNTDTKKFSKAVSYLEQGFRKNEFVPMTRKYKARFISIITDKAIGADFCHTLRLKRIASGLPLNNILRLRRNSDIFAAQLEQLVKYDDVDKADKIKWWIHRYIIYLKQRLETSETLLDVMVLRSEMYSPLLSMIKASQAIGLKDMEQRLIKLRIALLRDREAMNADQDFEAVNTKQSKMLNYVNIVNKKLVNRVDLTDKLIAPSRYVEHALVGRMLATVGWIVTAVVFLAAWIYGFIRTSHSRELSLKFSGCLKLNDWLLIIAGGVVLPVLLYWLIVHCTGLSAREWTIQISNGVPVIGQFVAMFVSVLGSSVIMVRWRLRKRLPMIMKPVNIYHYVAVGFVVLGLISLGGLAGNLGVLEPILWAIILVPTVYLIVTGIIFYLGRANIDKYLVNRILLPVIVCVMLMMNALGICFYLAEKHYVATDPLMSLDPKTGWVKFESTVTDLSKKELQERLDILGK